MPFNNYDNDNNNNDDNFEVQFALLDLIRSQILYKQRKKWFKIPLIGGTVRSNLL